MTEFGDEVAAVLDGGPCEVGVESTIVDLSSETPRLLRPGMIPVEALEHVLKTPLEVPAQQQGPRAPGGVGLVRGGALEQATPRPDGRGPRGSRSAQPGRGRAGGAGGS